MDPLLKILQKSAKTPPGEIACQLNLSEEEVRSQIAHFEKEGVILGYHTVIDRSKTDLHAVTAVIEVRITPEREGGFERIAHRIARFDEVESVYLMSGGYDLLVIVEGHSLHDVAAFVAHKLSTIEAVQSCATRFRLKTYKEHGVVLSGEEFPELLAVSP